MKLPKAFVALQLAVMSLTAQRSNKQYRGMKLSDDKQVQHRQQTQKLALMNRRHNDENALLEVKFGINDTDPNTENNTENYSRYMTEKSSAATRQDSEKQQLTAENKEKEGAIDLMIDQNEVQLKAINADLDGLQKVLDNALKGDGMD